MPDRLRHACRLLLLLALSLLATGAIAAPRIGVVTMQPGEIFFERFGHNSIVVDDPATGEAISYNYGFFDMTEPDFFPRFIRGQMNYRLVAQPLDDDLEYYRDVGRGVSVQWLDLTDAEARELAAFLKTNARPENARYGYDYFLDNCSTRVRDAIDGVLDGGLRRQTAGRSQGLTYRGEATRLASPAPWMWLGFDVGLGPSSDRPLSRWEESFVPMRLADALRGAKNSAGRPLVAAEQEVLPHRLAPEPAESGRTWWAWGLAGLVLGGMLLLARPRAPRLVGVAGLAIWTVAAIAGSLMLFIWLGTAHRFGWANWNLLLFSPLCWLMLPGAWRAMRLRDPGRLLTAAGTVLLAGGGVALFANWLSVVPQENIHWIAFMLPVHAALFAALRQR